MAIPIFLIHWGNSDYLKYCIHQARHYNPESEIILIGDRSNNKYSIIRHYHASGYSFNANLFGRSYVHLNRAIPHRHLKSRFTRWFVLNDFMKAQRFGEEFVYVDPDVLLYCDVTEELGKLKDKTLATGNESVPHCTYFSSVKSLNDLCDFIVRMYSEPDLLKILTDIYERHESEGKPGGVDDITVIREYIRRHPVQTPDNADVIHFASHENNFSEAQGYEYDNRARLKKVYWKDGSPFGKHLPDGNLVKFNSLHFTGNSKSVMHRYYSGKNLRMRKIMSEVRNSISLNGWKS